MKDWFALSVLTPKARSLFVTWRQAKRRSPAQQRLVLPAAGEAVSSRNTTTIDEVTEEHWQIARQREQAIADIDSRQDVTDQVQRTASRLGVSRRTVFRWLTAYRETPQTSTLLPRPVGPRVGSRRLVPELEKLITQAINDVYLQKVRAKKEEVVRMVGLRSCALGLKPHSRKPILARLKALDLRIVARARLQPGEAASLYDFVPRNYQVSRALEVVQIDHTPMDVIVVDEARLLPIGRPWLTLAVRCRHAGRGWLLRLHGGPFLNLGGTVPHPSDIA